MDTTPENTLIPAAAAMEMAGVTRQRIHQVAKKRGWARIAGPGEGTPWFYRLQDITDYIATRKNGRPKKDGAHE